MLVWCFCSGELDNINKHVSVWCFMATIIYHFLLDNNIVLPADDEYAMINDDDDDIIINDAHLDAKPKVHPFLKSLLSQNNDAVYSDYQLCTQTKMYEIISSKLHVFVNAMYEPNSNN